MGDAGGCCDGDPYLLRRLKRCEEAEEQALVCSAWSRRAAYGLTHLKRPCGGRALKDQGTTHPSPHNCGTWPVSPAHSSDDMHACDCAGHVTYHGATVHGRCEATVRWLSLALWLMPAWVWRDIRSLFVFVESVTCRWRQSKAITRQKFWAIAIGVHTWTGFRGSVASATCLQPWLILEAQQAQYWVDDMWWQTACRLRLTDATEI